MQNNGIAGSANDQAGSSIASGPNANNLGSFGQPAGDQVNYEAAYKELEGKLGTMGKELGDFRSFFENISPLLEQLDKSPELVQSIIDGKVDGELAKAVGEGRISIGDAKMLTQAHTEVQKELGKKGYEKATSDDIAKLIEERVSEAKQELEGKMTEAEDMRTFESHVNDFISRTTDFADYAKEIDSWLDEHDVTDIEVAYYAVKGQVSERTARGQAERNAAENAKSYAMNAGGGGSRAISFPEGSNPADFLIAGKSNPNVF